MPKVQISFDGPTNFAPVPENTYDVRLDTTRSEMKEKSISIAMRIMGGEHNDRLLFDNLPLSEKGQWKIVQLLAAVGLPYNKGDVFDTDLIHNKTCRVTVKHEDYQGEPQARIKKYMPIPDSDSASTPSFNF